MANMTLNQYLHEFCNGWESNSGTIVSELLSFNHPHVMSSRLTVDGFEKVVKRIVEPPLDEIVILHLRCLNFVNQQKFLEAYAEQSSLVQAFTKLFQAQKEQNWALYIMYVISLDIRLFAIKADRELANKGADKPGQTLEKAAECLMGLFRVCAADNRSLDEDTKRWGMLYLVNQLLKIYYRINKLHLCKALIRAIDASQFRDQFSLSQQVTYKYYTGRKAIFESDFKTGKGRLPFLLHIILPLYFIYLSCFNFITAEKFLTYAFERCHKSCRTNKRLILIYLIPVKMLLGNLPAASLLHKYDLLEFSEVVQAVKEGNLLRLNRALHQFGAFFIRCGVYLILEKLKVTTYRNLFKKVTLLMKTHQIPIEAYLAALRFMEVDEIDLDETQCIIANLIFENKIKGYISNTHNKLVISKQNPFPPLATIS